jgi:DNA-binding GntR family transcriptional regulator
MAEEPFHRPPTTQQAVLDELRELLRSGRLRPGDHIVQDRLAEQLGISRVPLREALKTMLGEGHVSYAAHRGYVVTELSLEDLVEVYRIRDLLEPEALRAAVPRLSTTDVERVEMLEQEVLAAAAEADVVAMSRANRAFHLALVEPCARPRLLWHLRLLWDATDVYRLLLYADEVDRGRVEAEHRTVRQAVVDRDVEALLHAVADHRSSSLASLRQLLGR